MILPSGTYHPDPEPRRPSGLRLVLVLLAVGIAAIPLVYGATILVVEIAAAAGP